MKAYICEVCRKSFTQSSSLRRHQRAKHIISTTFSDDSGVVSYTPELLATTSTISDQTASSIVTSSVPTTTADPVIDSTTASSAGSGPTSSTSLSSQVRPVTSDNSYTYETAIKGSATIYKFHVGSDEVDLETALRGLEKIKEIIIERLQDSGLKWYPSANIHFSKAKDPEITTSAWFRSKCMLSLQDFDLDEQLNDAIIQTIHNLEKFMRQGSDWLVDGILAIELLVVKYIPLRGSSYIKLPTKLLNKKAIINIKNSDDKCFAWAVLAAVQPVECHSDRTSKYNLSNLNLTGLNFPMKISQVAKFEKQNNISVNVFGYDGEKPNKQEVFPLFISKLRSEKKADLLLISEGDNQHYCTIRNLSRLLKGLTKVSNAVFYCRYCLHRYCREDLLLEHLELCAPHGAQKIKMPTEEKKWLKFKNIERQLRVPFTIFADFECFITKLQHCVPDPSKSSTTPASIHIPCGFAYVVVGPDSKIMPPVVYRGPNVVDTFLEHMLILEIQLGDELDKNLPIKMTDEDIAQYNIATICHICKKPLGEDRVRDHCHMSGKFRGAAHSTCNLEYEVADHIPIVFHGLRNYDSHLIMQGLGKIKDKEIKCIPIHLEKYMSFTIGRLRYIDSVQFLNASLEKLTENLAKEGSEKFDIMAKCFPEEKLHLLLRKGIYPYSYVDGESRFEETRLPSKEAFYNDLTKEDVSEEDYLYAQTVWNTFKIKNLGEYHDLYLKTDILLLADVFENFREICMNTYDLDPCHYYTSPGLAWDACLKMTNVNLELFTDIDMYLFVESGIRGGVAMISKRYATANNKYLEEYDSNRLNSHIIYLDINNLYGWAMSPPLPQDSFSWLSQNKIEELDVPNIPPDGDTGYIMCVDLEYPTELHDLHNCYPLAPEAMEITEEMLSPYSKQLKEDLNLNFMKTTKLVPNLHNKTNYTVHYRNLQQYLSLGLKLTKIHKVLKFRQSPWLKRYIDLNTNCRKIAKNDFEKDFFKLMNNSVYGKCLENLRNRVNIQLVQDEKKLLKLSAQPAFHAFKIFDSNLVAVERKKVTLCLNRPIYAGFSILDLSKTCMYDFHYNYVKPRFGDKAELLFTDTDSLTYSVETEDIYKDFEKDQDRFDFSGYPSEHFLHSKVNMKIIGKMKDEMDGTPIQEFVGLRPKMYSIKSGRIEKKTAKGVTRSVIASKLRHVNYKECLLNRETLTLNMTRIVSERHRLYTSDIRKLALSAGDDKRYILTDGIHSLAYGHYRISKHIEES